MEYKKPQSTLVQGGVGIYPLTTADQVILSDGSRLEKDGKINADKLGGKTLAEIMLELYPVGAVYISVNSTSPASLFGGTWEQIEDRFLLAAGSTYAAGSAGGEATHTLTEEEMPSHIHKYDVSYSGVSGSNAYVLYQNSMGNAGSLRTNSVGGGAAHNNMPPYLAVYVWKRVS